MYASIVFMRIIIVNFYRVLGVAEYLGPSVAYNFVESIRRAVMTEGQCER